MKLEIYRLAMTDADVVYPITGNKNLIMAGLLLEDDDDIHHDATALFGVDLLGSGSAPIDLDGDGAGAVVTAIGTPMGSNTSSTNDTLTSSISKQKSSVWVDFEEIYVVVNGNKIQTQAICRMCKAILSARSTAGTDHLIRHQKAFRKKTDHADRVQSRLAFNPDGSLHNWDYNPAVARSELCRLIARLDLPLGIGKTEA
jgi:hypothetical protein